ncbi:TetR/AcrR family transcriptional regulator [Sanguibacter sp. A247]|uniref:TetR/AcrR family transcriptional regulator n=1 Tax=unclassified Sanguibacter TaxID=2645534 RepID=UPI003FD8040A
MASSTPSADEPSAHRAATQARAGATRGRILDAFARLLVENGERAATLDAVAMVAGVSKGGLLYHFGSKVALVDGLLERMVHLALRDVDAMRNDPRGAVAYLIRTSAISDTPFDLDYLAATRLAEGPFPQARIALTRAHEAWLAATQDAVGDPVLARAIVLISDGLYLEAATRRGPRTPAPTLADGDAPAPSPTTSPAGAAELVALLESVIASRRGDPS